MLNTARIPINRKLVLIYSVLMATLVAVAALAFATLDRFETNSQRVVERYVPQLETISDIQMLMFRISLEARHAMLATTPEAREATFGRIGDHRKDMLAKLDTFESRVTTPEGRANLARIREADAQFWRLGGEVLGKVQAGDVPAAFAQLEADLVPARDVMVSHIAQQRAWQLQLVTQAVVSAQVAAERAKGMVLAITLIGAAVAAWMAWSLARMMQGAFARAQSVTGRIAAGNLGSNIYVRKGDEFGHLFSSIADMQDRLLQVVTRVRGVADQIVQSAQAIDEANQALSRAADSQAGSVRATSESSRRMTDAVRQSAHNVEQVNQLAREAAQVAERGGTVVGEVVGTMNGIDSASQRIADIVGVIDGIAFQTNILALNAAVEAARAGEEGRGFAVVAGEVRSLAQRSAAAAREVKALIHDSVERVGSGTQLAQQAGQTMEHIVGSVTEVRALLDRVALGARSQHADVDAMSSAVDRIDSATSESVDAVARSNAAAAALRTHAQALEAAVAAFNLDTRRAT